MNENLNLVEILKDCPKGTTLYTTIFGDVELVSACKNEEDAFPIEVKRSDGKPTTFTKNGRFYFGYDGECTLFPSREQRDWSKFTAPLADEHPANVWHDAKEKPRVKEWILIQSEEDYYETFSLSELGVEMFSDWWCKNYKVVRWAYVSDLLTKTK